MDVAILTLLLTLGESGVAASGLPEDLRRWARRAYSACRRPDSLLAADLGGGCGVLDAARP